MAEGEPIPDTSLRELFELRNMVDDLIEEGLVHRWSVSEVLGALLPRVGARLGVTGAFVETYGEDLALRLFAWSGDAGKPLPIPDKADVFARTSEEARERVLLDGPSAVVVAQHLDVAGAWFGRAGLIAPAGSDAPRLSEALNAVCEVLDNYLFSIRAMREKHLVMMRLGNALRHRVLGEGVKQAVSILTEAIPMERMVIVYVAEENAATTLHVQMFDGDRLAVDTLAGEQQTHTPLRVLGREYLAGESTKLLDELGVTAAQEEVLINGITKSVVVGKVVVTSKHGVFNTYDRELLSAFAGFIRQRVVDFHKEWRSLAYSFRPDDVARLLQNDEYERRFLAPREETVAILYVDIAGFTRISETVLKTPAKVAELVETWSRDAVELVWEHGGVFDKMVGDCVIALFGPPFYDDAPGERLARALRCAKAIRAMTNALPQRVAFEVLREGGIAVSTGVNLAPLFVGQFGPNSNFTGFSSGMNNTARLQGCAGKDEILVMAGAIEALPADHGFEFGEPKSAVVKNVADPLEFRALV
ncbi:MAG: adenylate/guanylate cyclase domain-containing protein [Labilithrix sp.]|nr:adenylate/guanylate cyclase domain-containing protein [Labilithrix sp.]